MPSFSVKPFAAKPAAGTGYSMSLGETKVGQYIRLSLTIDACKHMVGRVLDPEKDQIAIRLNTDPGKTHLIGLTLAKADDPDGIPLSAGTRGGVYCKLQPWRQVPKGKLPARGLQIVGGSDGAVMLKLPDWARPDPFKAGSGS